MMDNFRKRTDDGLAVGLGSTTGLSRLPGLDNFCRLVPED